MLRLTPFQLTLLDGVETEHFGYVRFLTVNDLLEIGEKKYSNMLSVFSQSAKAYELDDKFRDFDLFFLKTTDGNGIKTSDGQSLMDSLVYGLSVIYGIEKNDIEVDDYSRLIKFTTKDKFEVTLHKGNYDELAMIVLDSCMSKKVEKEKEVEFKGNNKELQEKYLNWKKREKERDIKNAPTMAMILNNVMIDYKLITDKKSLIAMTVYNLLFAHIASGIEDSWEMSVKQYLAGADRDKLDLTHKSVKLNNVIKQEE